MPSAQRTDVSSLIPTDLDYSKDFVQLLSDSGWSIQAVRPSKFNGFFRETKKAAFIKTDKGILEVIFFETNAAVEEIQMNEESSEISGYHKYVVRSAKTTQKIEGAPAYFTKYRNMLIVTIDGALNDKLSGLLTSPAAPAM